jgi:hypothetical protein
MADHNHAGSAELEAAFWHLYRDFFDKAERKRRWSVREDIVPLPEMIADLAT